jgi:hypothetical protein
LHKTYNKYISSYTTLVLASIILFSSSFKWLSLPIITLFAWVIIFYPNDWINSFSNDLRKYFSILFVTGCFVELYNAYLFYMVVDINYWIISTLIWLMIITSIKGMGNKSIVVHNALVASGWIATIGNLIYIFLFLSGNVSNINLPWYNARFGLDERGFFAFSTSHIPILGYLIPYVSYGMAREKKYNNISNKILLLLMVTVGLLSLRTAICAIIVIAIMMYTFVAFNSKKLLPILMVVVTIFVLFVAFNKDNEILTGIYNLKLSTKISGDDPRYNQLKFWIDAFRQSPFLGNGISSTQMELYDMSTGDLITRKKGIISNPYGYEIFYGRILSEIGLIFLVYVAVFYKLSFKHSTFSEIFWQVPALRFASLCMLFQSATNTYLYSTGWLFVIMLQIIFNIDSKNEKNSAST